MNLRFDEAARSLIREDVISKLRSYEDIIIYGAGMSGEWVLDLLQHHGMKPRAFCDGYAGKWRSLRRGLPIDSFENTIRNYPEAAICIASMWSEEIAEIIRCYDERLIGRTFDLLTTMAWETSSLSFASDEGEYIRQNEGRFEELKQSLGDEKSRNTLEGILNYRLTRDKKYLAGIISRNQTYLDRDILTDAMFEDISSGVMVDGGAFDGDTVELFIKQLGDNALLDIVAYEGESKNCRIITDKMEKYLPHRVHVYEGVIWNVAGDRVCFVGNGMSGVVSENGAEVETITIDDTISEKVSFIKLDIEGAERYALWGGKSTIERDEPVLAICGYHLQDDLLVLCDIIKTFRADYSIYLRHYMMSSGDTIIYGIPKRLI